LAGIASIGSLQKSPSYEIYGKGEWPRDLESVLVLALAHDEAERELDWWDGKRGTPGNRRLESIANSLRKRMKEDLNSDAHLPVVPFEGSYLKIRNTNHLKRFYWQ